MSSFVGFVLTIPSGFIADHFDSKRLIIIALSSTAALCFIFAAFTTYPVAIAVWIGLRFSTGLGYWPSLIKFINGLAGPEDSGKSFSLYYTVYGLSAAFVNVAEVWAGSKFGFSGAVVVIGCINAVSAVLDVFLLDGDKDKEKRGEIVAKQDSGDKIRVKDLKYIVKWPGTYILAFAYVCTYTLYSNVSYFNPYLVNVMGVPAEISSVLSIIRTYFLMLVCPIGGIMADKVLKSTSKTYILAFCIIGVMFAVALLFKPGMNMWIAAVYSLLPSLVVMPLYSITYSIMRELHFAPSVLGTAVAVSGLLGPLVDMVPPPIFGAWLDKYGNAGYSMIFITLITMCVLGSLVALWAMSHNKKCLAGQRVMTVREEDL